MPSPAEMIRALLSQAQPSLPTIAEAFEALSPEDRVAATRGLNRADQRRLFELAVSDVDHEHDSNNDPVNQRAPHRPTLRKKGR